MMINADLKYNAYVRKCIKKPKNFNDWLILMYKIEFHNTHIRPCIIWWQKTRQELNMLNHKG